MTANRTTPPDDDDDHVEAETVDGKIVWQAVEGPNPFDDLNPFASRDGGRLQ